MTTPVLQLSADLLTEILDACDTPRDWCNLAATCKDLYRLAGPTIRRHRDVHCKFRFTSDLDPTTFPALIRSAVLHRDPVVRRYARSIDVWVTRRSWREWRQCLVDEGGVHMEGEVFEDERFTDLEVEQLLALTRELVGESELDAAREELDNGADSLLKFLVIASCPNLENLKFVRRDDAPHNDCQEWLRKCVHHTLRWDLRWPAGLASLRDVAYGVDAGIANDHIKPVRLGRGKGRTLPAQSNGRVLVKRDDSVALALLIQLPALKSLYFYIEDRLEDGHYALDDAVKPSPNCSNVQSIYLDNYSHVHQDFPPLLTGAARKLETLSIRFVEVGDCMHSPDTFVTDVAATSRDSLTKFMFYNPQGLNGYRCDAYVPEVMVDFVNLKMWYQSVSDMELDIVGAYETEREDMIQGFKQWVMPNVEVLVMAGELGDFCGEPHLAWDNLDHAVAAFIIHNQEGTKSLKALFLPVPKVDTLAGYGLPHAVRVAEEVGIDIYNMGPCPGTATKRHNLDFPQAVTKWDIRTGPNYGKRREQGYVAFSPLDGSWHPEVDAAKGYYLEL